MLKPIKIILKVHGALALGVIVGLALFQEDPWLKERFETIICQACTEALGEPVSLKVTKLDLFSGDITAEQVHATSRTGSWSFKSPVLKISFSWLSLIKSSRCATELVFYKPVIYTKFEQGAFALTKPFLALVYAPTALPLLVVRTDMQQATVVVDQAQGTIRGRCSSSTDVKPQTVTTHCFVHEGSVESTKGGSLIEKLAGSMLVDVPVTHPEDYSIKMHFVGDIPSAKRGKNHVFLGFYKQGHATAQWHPEDRSCSLQAPDIVFGSDAILADLVVSGSLHSLLRYLPLGEPLVELPGSVQGTGQLRITEMGLHYTGSGQITGLMAPTVTCTLEGDTSKVEGTILVEGPKELKAEGTWSYTSGILESSLALKKKYTGMPQVTVESASCTVTATGSAVKARGMVQASSVGGAKARISAQLDSDLEHATVKGTCNGGSYKARCSLFPFELRHCSYTAGNQTIQLGQNAEGSPGNDTVCSFERSYFVYDR